MMYTAGTDGVSLYKSSVEVVGKFGLKAKIVGITGAVGR